MERVWVEVVGRVTVAKRDWDPLSLLPLLVLVEVLFVIVGLACGPPPLLLLLVLLVVVLPVPGVLAAEDPGGFPPALICTWISAWIGAALTTAWIKRATCIWALLVVVREFVVEDDGVAVCCCCGCCSSFIVLLLAAPLLLALALALLLRGTLPAEPSRAGGAPIV